jgi:translation elongation factor EF-G
MKVYKTNEVKNIALLGSAKSGKTTLAESMLFEADSLTAVVQLKIKTLCPITAR